VQFKIPQDVQLEDRIIGPLTMKQLGICIAGGSTAYVLYLSLAKNFFWEVWAIPVGTTILLTVLIAFIRIVNVSFMQFILLLIEYVFKPRKRLWIKGDGIIYDSLVHPLTKKALHISKKIEEKKDQIKSLNDIKEISKVLDSKIKK
jgi:hypothetical protein